MSLTDAPSRTAAVGTQACFSAVDGVSSFIRRELTPTEIDALRVPHARTSEVAATLYERFGARPDVIDALGTVRPTTHCHIAVFVAAIRAVTEE